MQKLIAIFLVILQLLPFPFVQFLPFATQGAGPENAYLAVLEEMISNDSIKHISVNPERSNTADNPALVKALQMFCENHGKTLYLEPLWELNKKGLLGPEDQEPYGFSIGGERLAELEFANIKQRRNSLTGVIGWLCGDCWGIGYKYKVRRIGCTWYIISKESAWVS